MKFLPFVFSIHTFNLITNACSGTDLIASPLTEKLDVLSELENIRELVDSQTIICSLCSGGNLPGNPSKNVTIPLLDNLTVTCEQLDGILKSLGNQTDQSCNLVRGLFGDTCGCPLSASNTSCPGLCSDGSLPLYPSRITPLPVDFLGRTITCLEADILLKSQNADSMYCTLGPTLGGAYCGCSNAPKSCTPCYENEVMPNYAKQAYENVTCGDIAITAAMLGQENVTLCNQIQAMGASFCDCPKSPESTVTSCSLCPSGSSLNSSAIYFDASSSSTLQCSFVETGISSLSEEECSLAKAQKQFNEVQSSCCFGVHSTGSQTSDCFYMSRSTLAVAIIFGITTFVLS